MYGINKALFFFLAAAALFSCGIIRLGDLDIDIYPQKPDSILGACEHIRAGFPEEIDRNSFESLFRLTGPDGAEEGDFHWECNTVEFVPHKEMQPGFRYRLKITGNLKTADGKSFPEYIDIPFYYLTDDPPPVLVSSSPADAETVDIYSEIILEFSKAVGEDSFHEGFRINPSTEFTYSWNDSSTTATVTPVDAWINLKYYRWTLSDEIIDESGIPLPKSFSGTFLVQADTSPPRVESIHPATDNGDGSFTILSALTPDDLLSGQHIAVLFSEEIDFSSLRQRISFAPQIDGYIAELDPATALFYIDEKLTPDSVYELSIGEGLQDSRGNLSTDEWSLSFTPSIPAREISSIVIEDQNGTYSTLGPEDFNNDGYIDTPGLDYYGSDSLHFIVFMTEGIPSEYLNERMEFESKITLSPVFPPGTAAPSVHSSIWETRNRLRLIYEGLLSCTVGEPIYYRFNIAAGSMDSASPEGSYLLDKVLFNLLAEVQ